VGIAILTLVIGALNPKGYVYEISIKIAPWFATLYLVALYLSIEPLLCYSAYGNGGLRSGRGTYVAGIV